LLADTLPDSPLLLVFLALEQNSNQALSFVFAENGQEISDMFYDSKLDIIKFVLEKDVESFKQVLFCH
jgi:dsDNA-binding SOS-regulon protein